MTNLKIFSRNIQKLGCRYLIDRNPYNQILFFTPKVLSVNKQAQIQAKFKSPVNTKSDQFVYFSEINLQLSLLFTTQMQFVHVVLDIYNQMCEDYFEFIKSKTNRINTDMTSECFTSIDDSFFPQKFNTNQSNKSDQPLNQSKYLLNLISKLDQLTYAVGCFNAYSSGLMTLLDQSLFQSSIFVSQNDIFEIKPDQNDFSSQKQTRNLYLFKIFNTQLDLSQNVFSFINNKFTKMETFLSREIPNLSQLYSAQCVGVGQSDSNEILPRLFQFQLKSQSKSISIQNISQMVYAKCSELVLLQSKDHSTILFDLHFKQVLYIFQWHCNFSQIIIKRNLNTYKTKLVTNKCFKRLKAFPRKIDILFQDEDDHNYITSNSIILENELKHFLYSLICIKQNFQHMLTNIWIHTHFKNESFVFAASLPNQLFVFKLQLSQNKKQTCTKHSFPIQSLLKHKLHLNKVSTHANKTSGR